MELVVIIALLGLMFVVDYSIQKDKSEAEQARVNHWETIYRM